jgi:hypothetical protein
MAGQNGVFDVCAGEAEEVGLRDRVIGPRHDARFRGHETDLDVTLEGGV